MSTPQMRAFQLSWFACARWLCLALFAEGVALMLFSQVSALALALPTLMLVSLCVQMSNGATFSVVPCVNTAEAAG